MSLRFLSQRITVWIPARFAARIFSFIPPTGSTLPRSVNSPVMAMRAATLRPVNVDARDVSIVMPAEGPSLGMAPSGTWMCTSFSSNLLLSIPNRLALLLRYWSAIMADSFMTVPKLPVSVSLSPLPGESADSMKRISPPAWVHARPVTTPGLSLFS